MNLKLTDGARATSTGVTGLKIIRAIVAGERDPQALAQLRDRRCKHTAAEIATALDGRYRPEHVTELRLCLTMWETYQEVIAELDEVIAAQLRAMRRQTDAAAAAAADRGSAAGSRTTRGSTCATALYYATGVDLTAIEGIDEIHALTLVSELGSDFTKWPTVKHFTQLAGAVPELEEDRAARCSRAGRGAGKNRAAGGAAAGGVEPDAEQELPGGVPAAAAVAAGRARRRSRRRPTSWRGSCTT